MSIADYSMFKLASNSLRAAKRTLRTVTRQMSTQIRLKNRLMNQLQQQKTMIKQQFAAAYSSYSQPFMEQMQKALQDGKTSDYQMYQQQLYQKQQEASMYQSIFEQQQEQVMNQKIEEAENIAADLEQRKENAQADVDYWSEAKNYYQQQFREGNKEMFNSKA